ncbi:hypothetical protein Q7P36_008136 [Cladosporium allicinum]
MLDFFLQSAVQEISWRFWIALLTLLFRTAEKGPETGSLSMSLFWTPMLPERTTRHSENTVDGQEEDRRVVKLTTDADRVSLPESHSREVSRAVGHKSKISRHGSSPTVLQSENKDEDEITTTTTLRRLTDMQYCITVVGLKSSNDEARSRRDPRTMHPSIRCGFEQGSRPVAVTYFVCYMRDMHVRNDIDPDGLGRPCRSGKRPGHKLDNRSIDVERLLRMHTESVRSQLINLVNAYKQKKEVPRPTYQYQRQ